MPLGWQVEIDAEPSRFVDFGNMVLDRRLSAGWDAAYVFLGTNYHGDQQSYQRQLEKIIQRLAPTPVVLLTVTEFAENRRQVNDVITLMSAQFPSVHLLDWGAIAAADATTILRGDGHHLTEAGRAMLASAVANMMGAAQAQPGKCLEPSFRDDSGGNVHGSDKPPPKKVVPPPTTVKQQTATTVTTVVQTTTVVQGVTSTTRLPATTVATTTTPPSSQTTKPITPPNSGG